MNRRNILNITAITALGLALLPSSAVAQQKSLKEQLVGGWNLVAWERTSPDGTKAQAYGANPKGIAYYGADGRFFVLFARGDLPKIAANDRAKATPEEAKALVDRGDRLLRNLHGRRAEQDDLTAPRRDDVPKSVGKPEADDHLAHGG